MIRALLRIARWKLVGLALFSFSSAYAQDCKDQSSRKQFQSWIRQSGVVLNAPANEVQQINELTSVRSVLAETSYVLCRDWPAKPGLRLILVTLPLSPKEAADSQDAFELDAVIFVIDANQRIVASSSVLKKYLFSDGEMLTDVTFDTARYQLDANTMGFGIRVGHQVGRWDTSGQFRLDLFFARKATLLHALKSFPVNGFSLNRGLRCEAVAGEFHRSLAISNSKSFGLADLRVVQSSTLKSESISPKNPDDCVETIATEPERRTALRFNGSYYEIPEGWN